MEGVVAKRCLRESSRRENRGYDLYNSNKKNIDSLYRRVRIESNKVNDLSNSKLDKIKHKIKMKLWIQSINAMCILIVVVSCNMMNVAKINENKYIKIISTEYSKSYDVKKIKTSSIKYIKKGYKTINKIIPSRIKEFSKKGIQKVRGYLTNSGNNERNQSVGIYLESNKSDTTEGKGVSIEDQKEELLVEDQSSISTQVSSDETSLKSQLLNQGISFIKPTEGTISSEFGDREVIFTDVDPFHTGIDIANKSGTKVVSSTSGKVTKVAYNKYNGNFIEITTSNVITKYAHLKSVDIAQGSQVSSGDKIGEMGQTGYATGPHLHFEVVVDGKKINPREVLDF